MISRGLLWFIALAFIGVLVVTWWSGRYPAQVVVLNQAGTLREMTLTTSGKIISIGELRRGESRAVKVPSGDYVTVDFRTSKARHWTSLQKTTPAQSLIVTVSPEERVVIRAVGAARRGIEN